MPHSPFRVIWVTIAKNHFDIEQDVLGFICNRRRLCIQESQEALQRIPVMGRMQPNLIVEQAREYQDAEVGRSTFGRLSDCRFQVSRILKFV